MELDEIVLVPLTQKQLHQIIGKLGGLPEFRSIRPREGQFTAVESMELIDHLKSFHRLPEDEAAND